MINKKKAESPRPDFYRENYISLNGTWKFAFDDSNSGLQEKWYQKLPQGITKDIQVPFCFQSELSGIQDTGKHEYVWYEKKIAIPKEKSKRTFLHFGAVDYEAWVWINGSFAGRHRGGHTPFSLEITNYYKREEEITISVYCKDSYACEQPRGKQHWNIKTDRCWYTATTGIWQDVWLEFSEGTRIEHVKLTPNIDEKKVSAELYFSEEVTNTVLKWKIAEENKTFKEGLLFVNGSKTTLVIGMEYPDPIDNKIHLWSPETPYLYDLELTLEKEGTEQDYVETYFGMRKIECIKDQIYLNHFPLYQKLVLDQGYWKEGLLTPPSKESFEKDITLAKEMGFNGVRKHQKVEAPVFLYYADCMGILVWEEMPSNYEFTEAGMNMLYQEYQEVLERDYNHPCIITWVPLNESWGVRDILWDKRQQAFAVSLYYLTKAYDATRPVSTNDGWETVTADMVGIHDYESNGDVLYHKYAEKEAILSKHAVGKMIYANGFSYHGEPVFLSEFGGVAMEDGKTDNWGYATKASDTKELQSRIQGLFQAVYKLPYLSGYCYTQLTDVEQETNGLLTVGRQPKIAMEEIRKIIK